MNLCRISRNTVPAFCLFFLLFLLVFRFPAGLSADVVTDGTVGPAKTLSGPDYQIPHDLGKTAGQNLFQSFQKFSVFTGESATFTGPDSIQNVISRVTGGEISNIDGLMRSQVGNADFFFINPSGVVFGPNAQVDVPASFHVSTADELGFSDGSVFSAASPNAGTLTAANPESFGFLSPQPARIELNGSRLEFKPESQVSLIGGNVSISGTTDQKAELVSEAGNIRITAMGNKTGEAPLSEKNISEINGTVKIESAWIESRGNGGGHIVIQAGNAELNAATVWAFNTGSRDATDGVCLEVDEYLEMLNGAHILSSTFSGGKAGNVAIRAGEIRIDGQGSDQFTGILSSTHFGADDAGAVNVTVKGFMEMINGAQIQSASFSGGKAGNVTIQTGGLRIDGQASSGRVTGIAGFVYFGGDADTMELRVDNLLEIVSGAQISTDTFGEGNAGSVKIHAGNLRIEDQGPDNQVTGVFSRARSGSSGNAGTVDITVTNLLEVLNGAAIMSGTAAKGNAGEVKIAAGEVRIDDRNSGKGTGITGSAHEDAGGHVGDVTITADTVSVLNGGQISIAANRILPEENLSDIPETAVCIDTGRLHLDHNAFITAESTGNALAAAIRVQADDMVVENNSRITTSASKTDGAPISVQGETLILRDGLITTSVEGETGNGGNITVSGINSGRAGVLVFDGGFIQASTAAENARGGDIFIDAKAVIADRDFLEVGGAERQVFEPGSGRNVIQAAAPGREQGSIDITAPNLNISSALISISSEFAPPVTLSADSCRAASGRNPGSPVLNSRGGIPPDPDHFPVIFFGKDRLDRLLEADETEKKIKESDNSNPDKPEPNQSEKGIPGRNAQ